MSLLDAQISTLDGEPTTLGALTGGKPALLVNVASKCGLTPQYEGLERIAESTPGLTVIGFPCNQFMGQEPGSPEEIQEFCSSTYGVTFPLTEKIEVNGEGRHEIYGALTTTPEASTGEAGDITWNFEKFLVDAEGQVVKRFGPRTEPEAPEVLEAINSLV
ncbi:glutathione peroxidase [Nocardioides sp. Kera G14]|uniref:glutathione peroxidase n=1 Tax=Nocardioides sp. Kera G14 TaxID=2884264 RepID=UPI001D0F5ECD|nr:glutathione peroxidase [Nocardioides sp. Kera G14]UDY23367.1 glutathione peroxidase [Nocardioides sp. Kera G14]